MKLLHIFLSVFFVLGTCTYAMQRKPIHSGKPFYGLKGKQLIKQSARTLQAPIMIPQAPARPITGGQSTQEDKDLAAAIKEP